jgi:four helix bundle protein
MDADELRKRTQIFAINIIRFVQGLQNQASLSIIGNQLLRCGTSVGANYRAACRAKSRPDFIAKLKIVEEECDESIYWMELLAAMQMGDGSTIASLVKEAVQILSIIAASIRTARTVQNRQS